MLTTAYVAAKTLSVRMEVLQFTRIDCTLKCYCAGRFALSVKIKSTFGAPLGASIPLGKSGVESLTVRPILPLNGCSARGRALASLSAGGAAIASFEGDGPVAASQPSRLANPTAAA